MVVPWGSTFSTKPMIAGGAGKGIALKMGFAINRSVDPGLLDPGPPRARPLIVAPVGLPAAGRGFGGFRGA